MTLKLGIFSWFGFVMPIFERLDLIKSAGFEATSLWWEDEEGTPCIPKDAMPEMVREAGLYLENIHAPFTDSADLWSESKSARQKILKEHTAWLEDCAKHEIPIMVMHIVEGDKIPTINKYGIESLSYLTKKAEEYNVKIALENTKMTGGIPFILSEIESPNLGLCYDTSHAVLNHEENLLEDFGEKLIALHISDNDGKRDRHWLPGGGTINWNKFTEKFPAKTFHGGLTLEVYPTDEESKAGAEAFLLKAFKSISRLAAMIDYKREDIGVS
ncbi:sugar phosphate isomerase/epimerase family protein [Tepidanaerobacter sp. EBM-49]|uniref:sugar phosphate isomerase/epimerase family protein n=1 Tax=Tepidanaerobacter sp. EBM-49 TaxID=1918504 RepID=UPI000A40C8D5|nr:sugar phosphate isomerase/epimerase family protein [Tepidanaerobacter sp. EBM-49]